MSKDNYKNGFLAEDLATKFLIDLKFEILDRNFHSRFGEIDIVAKKDEILHFIEVKSSIKNYEAEYRITKSKISKIIKTIDYFFLKNPLNLDYQIDAIIINSQSINFIKNITF